MRGVSDLASGDAPRDEARCIAANIAKLPQGAAAEATRLPTSAMTSTADISPDCAH